MLILVLNIIFFIRWGYVWWNKSDYKQDVKKKLYSMKRISGLDAFRALQKKIQRKKEESNNQVENPYVTGIKHIDAEEECNENDADGTTSAKKRHGSSCHGPLKKLGVDTTGDGLVDSYMVDTTGDGNFDVVGFDTTGDGEVDDVHLPRYQKVLFLFICTPASLVSPPITSSIKVKGKKMFAYLLRYIKCIIFLKCIVASQSALTPQLSLLSSLAFSFLLAELVLQLSQPLLALLVPV